MASVIHWRPWALALLFALLWHLAWLLPKVPWTRLTAPPRVEVTPIDASKLEAIRKSWDQKEKALLLDKDKSPGETEAPPDARYMSNKNRRVEREQRARESVILPKPGSRAAPQAQGGRTDRRALPELGNLGVKLPPPAVRAGSVPRTQSQEGGEQYIKDDNVPVGSENLLNSQESVFYSFYARLYEAIGPIWQSRINELAPGRVLPGEYTTTVQVIFDSRGNLLGVEREQASGIDAFDQAVDDSWRKIGRFPNPPQGLLDGYGRVRTGWTFTVTVRGGMPLEIAPPQRNY